MTEFEKILWGFGAAIGAILIGWMLNQSSEWFRVRRSDKRSLKQVLYTLLETYNLFLRLDFRPTLDLINGKIYDRIPEEGKSPQLKAVLNEMVTGMVNELFKPDLLEDFKKLQSGYADSIRTLAAIDPMRAFYLSGKISIVEMFDTLEFYFEQLKTKHQFPVEANASLDTVLDILKPDLLAEHTHDLEAELIHIAWKINPYVWYKTRSAVKRVNRNMKREIEKKIDELLNKLLPPIGPS